MSAVGQIEKCTHARVVALFRDRLCYDDLGDRSALENRNVEEALLRGWLAKQDVSEPLINRALHELNRVATDTSKHLYDRNKEVYDLLRYGVKVQPGAGENRVTVWLIDWKRPENNHFAVAEEVTVKGADAKASTKRPDVVIYINGIALGVLELKRSTVSVAEGIRQNLDNQKKEFIQPFFSTMQWVMAGNDTEGLRYATIETPEKYYLRWVENGGPYASEPNLLDRHLLQVCRKARLLELIHDFVVFDAGTKKLCRQNQYFGVKAAQEFIQRREGVVTYKEYLEKIAQLTKEATMPGGGSGGYPANVKTVAQRALYNNLGKDEELALAVDAAIQSSRMDDWRGNAMKTKRVHQGGTRSGEVRDACRGNSLPSGHGTGWLPAGSSVRPDSGTGEAPE